MIPKSEWKQFDKASHFCAANNCRFQRSTVIGDVVVSTVGDYRAPVPDHLKLHCNADGAEWVGADRFYETMVFKYDGFCTIEGCPCGGIPNIVDAGNPLDFEGYQTRADADAGHGRLCERWADPVTTLTQEAQRNGEYDR